MENAQGRGRLNETATQLIDRAERAEAPQLAGRLRGVEQEGAEASADTNRINQRSKELHTAEDVAKAADARVKYYRGVPRLPQDQQRYTQENMYWREAQYELAKSQLAQRNNIAPKGVKFDAFPKQEAGAQQARRSRRKAEARRREAARAERARAAG